VEQRIRESVARRRVLGLEVKRLRRSGFQNRMKTKGTSKTSRPPGNFFREVRRSRIRTTIQKAAGGRRFLAIAYDPLDNLSTQRSVEPMESEEQTFFNANSHDCLFSEEGCFRQGQ
jgi:hypothetical protein